MHQIWNCKISFTLVICAKDGYKRKIVLKTVRKSSLMKFQEVGQNCMRQLYVTLMLVVKADMNNNWERSQRIRSVVLNPLTA